MIIELMTVSLSGGLPSANYVCAPRTNYNSQIPFPQESKERNLNHGQKALDNPGRKNQGVIEGFYVVGEGRGIFGSSNPYVDRQQKRIVRQPKGRAKNCGSRKGRI